MKTTKKRLKLALLILICIAIILVGFCGIYVKDKNKYSNKIPNYKLATDLKGTTVLELDVDTSTNKNYYDSEGKKVDSSEVTDENKSNYTEKEEKVNLDENLTKDNYEKTLNILKERLKFLKVDQYSLDLDTKTGKIVLNFADEYPDDVKSILPMEGKLELIDSNTKDVLIENSSIKSLETTYASTDDGYTVYLNLKLSKEGIDKINGIDGYKITTDDNGEVSTNKFKVQFDTDEIAEVSYDNMELIGKTLRVTLASNITSNSTFTSKMNTATVVSKLTTIGKTPLVYKITAEEYLKTNVDTKVVYGALIVTAVLLVATFITWIIKYKMNGLLAVIGTLTNISLMTIVIRYTNIEISLNSLSAIIGLFVVNTYLVSNILTHIKNEEKTFAENIQHAYLKSIDVLIISLLMFVVFAFSKMTVINSMGLLFFWGWLTIVLGNLLFTVPMLYVKSREVSK